MGSLDRLHVQVHGARLRVRPHRSVPGVGQRAGLPIAESADVVFIAAEVLAFGCPRLCDISIWMSFIADCLTFCFRGGKLQERCWIHSLELVGAELLVDNLPDNLVGRHDVRFRLVIAPDLTQASLFRGRMVFC